MYQVINIQFIFEVGMKELLSAMHTGVSSAATHDFYFLPHQFAKGVFNYLLHPNRIGLILPPVIA